MGGGTTGAVALKLKRRFIGCDVSRVAVSVTASRLVEIGEACRVSLSLHVLIRPSI